MDFYRTLATLGGFLLVVAGTPQVFKLYKSKSSKDLSLMMFSLFLIGQISWFIYSIHIKDTPLILTNLSTGLISLIIIILIIKYRYAKD